MTPADLFHGASEQHHVVGGFQRARWRHGEFELAGPEFGFQGAQRQAEGDQVPAKKLKNRIDLVHPLFCQVVKAVGQQADVGR